MSEQKMTGAGQKLVPVGAPALGAVIMIAFVAIAFTMGKFDATASAITTKADQVTNILGATTVTPGIVSINAQKLDVHIADAEKRADFPARIKDQDLALQFPLRFRVTLEQPASAEATEFEKLDKNRDKTLSETEFLGKAGETKERFILKDKDKNKKLTPEEFVWEEPIKMEKTEFDLAAPGAVKAVLDYANPAVTVTWERPTLTDAPDDVAYLVYRAGPEHFLRRNNEYTQVALKEFSEKDQAYEQKYRAWKTGANAGKSRKQFAEETKDPEPVRPPAPSEWELLTPLPISDVTLVDKAFELDCAFIYAVRMVTAKKLKAGIKDDPAGLKDTNKNFYSGLETFHASEAAVQTGHPVYFPNRVSLSFVEVKDTELTARLTRWHKIGGVWRQVRAKFSAAPQDPLGRKYKVSELTADKKFELQALAEDGNPNEALLASLEANEEINFDSGWRYEARNAPNDPQISNKAGDIFVLPRGTRDPAAAPISPGAMVNPVEYRVIGATPQSTRFEFTRWVAGKTWKDWVRVVVQQDVRTGGVVGLKGKLSDLAKDPKTTIYDMGDNKVANVAAIAPQEISLETGTKYVKLNGRIIDLGDNRLLDIFGTQFAE